MLRAIYSLALWLALPLLLAKLWVRGRKEPGYLKGREERFGRYAITPPAPIIWVHAVSVGEVRASVPLIAALRTEFPGHAILLTCMTAAGREAIEHAFGDSVFAAYLPYDYRFAMKMFLDHFEPVFGVLVETEIWINLLAECKRRDIPMLLANGRMSPRSARAYRRLSALTRPAFESLAVVCAQSEADANRIASLGAHHVGISGNLKFDVQPDEGLIAAGIAFRSTFADKRVLVLASTREGEEALLINALAGRLEDDVLVIIVPRHPQRFDDVAALLAASGIACARRSKGESVHGKKVLLGDTMGEMTAYFAASDVAVIGGSFLPFGGQNLIEACSIGVPVIVGPYMHNFSEAVRNAVDCGAAIQVANAQLAITSAFDLLSNPARRNKMGAAGRAFCDTHRGATAKHMMSIRTSLGLPQKQRPEPPTRAARPY